MTKQELKDCMPTKLHFLTGTRLLPGLYIQAWVDLRDMNIYHSINGEVMALVFPTLEAFAKHIEQISEPQP